MFKSSHVMAARAGRVAFGLILVAGTAVLVRTALDERHHELHAWQIIAGTWVVAALVGLAVRAVATRWLVSRDGDALRRAALAVPAVGIALLMPLTLHMPFVLTEGEDVFDRWCAASVFFAGHTHVVFALLVLARAQGLACKESAITVRKIYVVTCLVAAFPFVVPALFVAVTGIPFIALLRRMESIAWRDRELTSDIPLAIAKVA